MECNFLVVQLVKHLDYISGVRHVGSFPTKKAADAFIEEKNLIQRASLNKRCRYIEEWVNAIEVPQINSDSSHEEYLKWEEYLNTFGYGFLSYYSSPKDSVFSTVDVSPEDFHSKLKTYLHLHYKVTIDGYNPPLVDCTWNGLYVVEIERPLSVSSRMAGDYVISFDDSPEAKEILFNKLLNWFISQECYHGESIMQSDEPIIAAPGILADIADDVFKFDVKEKG